jgi:hypothetical protein
VPPWDMTRLLLQHLRTHVVAYLALVVALTGTSYAAGVLPRNSVGAAQIKAGAVRSAEVKDGSLRTSDFGSGQLPRGPRGERGAVGPPGETGPSFVAVRSGFEDPVATPETAMSSFSFALPESGTVLVELFSSGPWAVCSAGSPSAGLYVDDVAVPATRSSLRTSPSEARAELFRGLVELTAGDHLAQLSVDCSSGSWTTLQVLDPSWKVTLVGS